MTKFTTLDVINFVITTELTAIGTHAPEQDLKPVPLSIEAIEF